MQLALYFGNSAAVWLRLQMQYDLEAAQDELGDWIKREVKAFIQLGTISTD